MINIPPIKQNTPIKVETIPQLTKAWKVGQILNATAQLGGEALSRVLIQVGKQTIEAKTPIPLQAGQEIKLLVKSLPEFKSDGQIIKSPLLSIIDTSLAVTQSNQQAMLKLRQFIAVVQSFSQLQQSTNRVLESSINSAKLPESLNALLSNLQKNLQINPNSITATQLKQQILNSGIFFESKLKNLATEQVAQKAYSSLNRDFKFQLLAIKAELTQLLNIKNSAVSQTVAQPATTVTTQVITTAQFQKIETFIKQSAESLNTNKINLLADRLITLLPKDSIAQLSKLLGGEKSATPAPKEIQFLVTLLNNTFQQPAQIKTEPLQDLLKFRLLLLELNQQIEQSISKVTSLQLQPMSRDGDNLIFLLFNLVFKDKHEQFDINFNIKQDTENNAQSDESWTVTLTFNFKTLGKVQAKIHLSGDQLSSTFYTEFASTAEKIKPLLPLLEASLNKAGLNILSLDVENTLISNRPFISQQINLLDENA